MMKDKVTASLKSFGVPRLIIAGFLLLLLIMAPFVGADLPTQISNIINRFSWNGILVLAMVPMVHSGCGLNFWPASGHHFRPSGGDPFHRAGL